MKRAILLEAVVGLGRIASVVDVEFDGELYDCAGPDGHVILDESAFADCAVLHDRDEYDEDDDYYPDFDPDGYTDEDYDEILD